MMTMTVGSEKASLLIQTTATSHLYQRHQHHQTIYLPPQLPSSPHMLLLVGAEQDPVRKVATVSSSGGRARGGGSGGPHALALHQVSGEVPELGSCDIYTGEKLPGLG